MDWLKGSSSLNVADVCVCLTGFSSDRFGTEQLSGRSEDTLDQMGLSELDGPGDASGEGWYWNQSKPMVSFLHSLGSIHNALRKAL